MDDTRVYQIVNNHLRGQCGRDDIAWLNAHPDEWYATLVRIKQDLEVQFAERRDDYTLKLKQIRQGDDVNDEEESTIERTYFNWKQKSRRFQQIVESHMQSVRQLRQIHHSRVYKTKRETDLQTAIETLSLRISELEQKVATLEYQVDRED